MAVKAAAKRVALETLGWIMVIGGIAAIPLPEIDADWLKAG